VAAVVGGASEPLEILEAAEQLGAGLVAAGLRVATGGLGGIMTTTSRGASQAPGWFDGAVIGVLPGLDARQGNPFLDVVIPSGLNFARNTVLVAMADVVIGIAGGAGTLSELALAWQHGKPVVGLDMGRGWSARLAGQSLDVRRDDIVHRATSVEEALELARSLAGSREPTREF